MDADRVDRRPPAASQIPHYLGEMCLLPTHVGMSVKTQWSVVGVIVAFIAIVVTARWPAVRTGEDRLSPGQTPQSVQGYPPPRPPQPPKEFRTLVPSSIPEAVGLMSSLGAGGPRLAERQRLADLYRAEGYHGAALFFENTIRIAEGDVVDPRPIDSPIAWTTSADVESERPQEVARETRRLSLGSKFREAIRFARRDIEEHGPSNKVVVQWADATLWIAGRPDGGVSDGETEAAVRIFLTAVEEYGGASPVGLSARTHAHAWVTAVFGGLGDPLSSFTAAILALLENAELEPGHYSALSPFSRDQLCTRVESLQRELELSDDWWPANRSLETVCADR